MRVDKSLKASNLGTFLKMVNTRLTNLCEGILVHKMLKSKQKILLLIV